MDVILKDPWKGRMFLIDIDVIKYLKENDKLFKKTKIST